MPGGVEIVQAHHQLLADIEAARPEIGEGAFWWMGQHSFIVKSAQCVFYIDPFFAPWESRQTPPPLLTEEAKHADYILITHGHGDHLDPVSLGAMVSASPRAVFICPKTEYRRLLDECGVPAFRIHAMNAGETYEANEITVTAVKSKHEFFDEDAELGFPFLGYVVTSGGVTVYHSGDTIPYDGLLATLQHWPHFDAAFLPINGRDAERFLAGCLGNLTFQEAAELAGDLNVGLAVPAHYDMFVGNQEDPSKFARYISAKYPTVKYWIGKAGERVTFGKRGG